MDLDRDFKDVLADMKPVNRNLYRNIHKKDVTFRSTQDPEDIRVLLNFLHMTAAPQRLQTAKRRVPEPGGQRP